MANLFPYQQVGSQWLAERTTALLADEMRLGKTCQALTAARIVDPRAPILVVGPAVARAVWRNEAATWRPDLRVRLVEKRGRFTWPRPGELIAVSYQLTPAVVGQVPRGTILILDEAQAANHLTSATTQRCLAMAQAVLANRGRLWVLTATPVVDRPREAWVLLGLLGQQLRCFASQAEFFRLCGHRRVDGRDKWGKPDPEVALRMQRIMLRRTRQQVSGELPPTIQTIAVPLKPELQAEADGVVEAMHRAVRERGLNIWEAYQYATSPASGLTFSAIMSRIALAKLPYLQQVVQEYEAAHEPLVVMSEYRGPVDALGVRPGWASITGDTSPRTREAIQEQFRAGKLRGVACTIGAAGVAIDLSTAAHLVMVAQAVSPGRNEQAVARIMGPRQTRPTCLVYLVCDHPLEQRLWDLLAEKSRAINGIVA